MDIPTIVTPVEHREEGPPMSAEELLTTLTNQIDNYPYRWIDWKPRTRVSYDTKRLAEEQPAIAEQYRKTTDYRVFSVREPKGADEE